MNTKSLLTRIAVPVLGLGLLGGLGATLATAASAATLPGTVTANTHSAQHPDTTNANVTATDPTTGQPGGDVWAYDNLTEKFTAVQDSSNANLWHVTINVNGSFAGFADPITGQALTSNGPVKGTIEYDVTSPVAPSASALPATEVDGIGLGVALGQLFGQTDGLSIFNPAHAGADQVTGGGDVYNFNYQNGNYTQIATPALTIHGDVTGH